MAAGLPVVAVQGAGTSRRLALPAPRTRRTRRRTPLCVPRCSSGSRRTSRCAAKLVRSCGRTSRALSASIVMSTSSSEYTNGCLREVRSATLGFPELRRLPRCLRHAGVVRSPAPMEFPGSRPLCAWSCSGLSNSHWCAFCPPSPRSRSWSRPARLRWLSSCSRRPCWSSRCSRRSMRTWRVGTGTADVSVADLFTVVAVLGALPSVPWHNRALRRGTTALACYAALLGVVVVATPSVRAAAELGHRMLLFGGAAR